jgi:HPt (histidine-containing phosphotransfer) domain-containing protein
MDDVEDNDKIAGVIQRFTSGLPQRLESIKNNIAVSNWSEAELLTHRLAGASLFGFPAVGRAAKIVENALQSQQYQILDAVVETLELTAKEELAEKNKSVLI